MVIPITEAGEADLGLDLTWAGIHLIMHTDIMPTRVIILIMGLTGVIADHTTVTTIISMSM